MSQEETETGSNPYQCPQVEDQKQASVGDVFRQASWLIVRNGDASLPPRCVFSGSTEIGRVRKIQLEAKNRTFGGNSDLPKVNLQYYCRPYPEGFYLDVTIWVGRGLLGMAGIFALMINMDDRVGFLGFFGFLLATIVFDRVFGNRRLKVIGFASDFLWISGVSSLFLSELPEWSPPKESGSY